MEFRQIQYFIAVAETKSLTHAVERLYIAQPALSQSIKNLEEELCTKLFERGRQGMQLTHSGETFLEHAYAIRQQINRAKESVRDDDENPQGTVSIALSASVTNVLSVPLFKLLAELYPNIELNLEEGLTGNLRQAFDTGLFDLMLEFDAEPTDNVSVEPIIEEDLYLISQFSSKFKPPFEIEFAELINYPLIVPRAQHGMGRAVIKFAEQQQMHLKTNSSTIALHPMIKLVEAGIGNSILPWSAVHELASQKQISARKIINPPMYRTVSMICPTNRPRSNATTKVMAVIRSAVKQIYAEDKWRGKLLLKE